MKKIGSVLAGAGLFLGGCVDDVHLVDVSDDEPVEEVGRNEGPDFQLGEAPISDPVDFGDDDDFSEEPVDDPTSEPFVLSELTAACIPSDVECEAEDVDCAEFNNELSAIRQNWADQLTLECGVTVNVEGLLEGDFDGVCQATAIAWDRAGLPAPEGGTEDYAGMIVNPGVVSRTEMLNRRLYDSWDGNDPLKCNRSLGYDSDGFVVSRFRNTGVTLDQSGTSFLFKADVFIDECLPGLPEDCVTGGDGVYLFYEDTEPQFSVFSNWVDGTSVELQSVAQKIGDLSSGGELDDPSNLPVATTELVAN